MGVFRPDTSTWRLKRPGTKGDTDREDVRLAEGEGLIDVEGVGVLEGDLDGVRPREGDRVLVEVRDAVRVRDADRDGDPGRD